MSDSNESKQVSKDLRRLCDCDSSFKINSIANWVELRERYYHGAVQFREKKQLEKAFHYFHHAIICDPKHVPSYEQIIHVLIELKKFEHTNYYLNKLNDVSSETTSILRGHVYFARNQYTNSEVQLQLSLNINPTSQRAIFLLGLRNLLLNRLDQSEINFEKLLRLNKNHLEAKFCLATIQMLKKKYDLAIEGFNKILILDSNFYLCYYHLALCYFMISDYETSNKYCQQTLKLHQLTRVFELISMNYFELRDQDGMESINHRIGSLYDKKEIKEDAYITNVLMQSFDLILSDPENCDKVKEDIQNCVVMIENSPNENLNEHIERLDYYTSIMNILKIYQKSDDLENQSELPLVEYKFHSEALDTYKLSNYLYLISLNYLRLNNDSECLKNIEQAIRLNRFNMNFYLIRNVLFMRKNDLPGSIELLKRVINLIPENNAKLRYFLALSFVQGGLKEQAIEQLSQIVSKEWKSGSKILFLSQFIDNDMTHETKHTEWFNYSKLFDSMPKLVKEKIICQHNRHVMDVKKLSILPKLDFHLYFDLKCVNYLLLKSILKYDNHDLENALNVLKKAERLDSDNIGVMVYLALIYLKLDPKRSEDYIQNIFDIKRRSKTEKNYLDFYRNKLTKFILDNPQIGKNLSNKTQCLLNVSYESFQKAKEIYIDMLDKNKDMNDENNRETYLDIFAYLIENLHRNKLDNELIYLSNTASAKLDIDYSKFDASNIDTNLNNEKLIISRAILYTGISYFNVKDYEKSKVLLERKFLNKQENLMASFYYNVLLMKTKSINSQIALKNFESILEILNQSKETESVLDKPEFDELEVIFFILLCNFRLKNFDECSSLIKTTYNQLKRNRPKLAYCEEEVVYINGILSYVNKNYDQARTLLKNLNVQDVEIQNEINFYKSISLYKVNRVKDYELIIEAHKALEKIPDEFETNIIDSLDFTLFKFKCLVYLIIKSWQDNKDDELRLFMKKFTDEIHKYKAKNEKVFYYRIIISSLISQDYTMSIAIVKDAISNFEKFRNFYYYAGLVAFRLKMMPESMKYLDKFIDESKSMEVLENNQMIANAYYFLALINQDFKNYRKSIEYFDSAKLNETTEKDENKRRFLIHDVYNQCDLLYFKSLSYLNLNEYDKTMELLNKILKIVDKDPKRKAFYSDDCKLILARTLIKNKEYKKALKTLKKIINLRSEEKRNQVYYYTGVLYFNIEEYNNALGQLVELPEDYKHQDCGSFQLLKLKCLFYLILKSCRSSQALIKSKLNSYLEQFNELIDNKSLDEIPEILETKTIYSILINYKVSQNYEKAFNESVSAVEHYGNEVVYLYYCGLSRIKDFMNLKFTLNEKDRQVYLGSSEAYFEKFIQLAKNLPGDDYDLKIVNSYYYLAIICQLNLKFGKANDFIDLLQTYNKTRNLDKNDKSEIEKLEIKIDMSEFNSIELDFLKAVVFYNLNKIDEAKEVLEDLSNEFTNNAMTSSRCSMGDQTIKLSQKNKINISNGVNYYLGAIHQKNNLDKSLEYFQKVKRRYNYFSESRYLIGLIYYTKKSYDLAYSQFKNLETKDFKDFDYKNDLNYYTVKTLFSLAKPEIVTKSISSKNILNNLIEKSDQILQGKDLQQLNTRHFEILVYKTWCLYYSEKFEQLYTFIEKQLFPCYNKYSDFIFLYAIASHMLYHKFKVDGYLDTSYKYFLEYILLTDKKGTETYLKDYFKDVELEIFLTSKYYLANVLTTKNYSRYEDGIKILIDILYYKNMEKINEMSDLNQMVNEGLKKSKLDDITKDFPVFKEFDVYDIIYYLGVNLNEIEMYEKSFQMLIALVNNFKLRDERKANEINFYLGFSKFKMEDYKNASEYFNKYKPTDDEYPKQVPKIELARYYIGICLYNKKDPDFVRAIKKFKEISQDYKNKEELSDLAHYLIDSNYKLALGYYKSNTHGKWNEYFSFTLEVCNEFLTDYNLDFKNFNPIIVEALEKKALSLYYLCQFNELSGFLAENCIKNFPQNITFYYIESLCFYKMITLGKHNSSDLKILCKQAIKSIQNYVTVAKETNQIPGDNKILNLRYIKSVIYLNYPDVNDSKIYLNSMDMLKGVKDEFNSESINDDDLIVFDAENLEYQEAIIYFLSGNYGKSSEQFEAILTKKYFKNNELKLSDVHYYLALSMIQLKKNEPVDRHKIIDHLKYVKKESKLYEKSKFFLAYVLFQAGELVQAYEFMQSFDKDENFEDDLKDLIDEYRIKIPFHLGNYYMSLRDHFDAIEKYKLVVVKSTEFMRKNKEQIQEFIKEEFIKIENFDTISLRQKIFYQILYYKLWSLFHLKNFSEIIKLVDEYQNLTVNLNDMVFLKAFSIYKINKDTKDKSILAGVSDPFEQYLGNKDPDLIIEKTPVSFKIERDEKNLISIYCLAEIHRPNFDKEFTFLNNLLSILNSNTEIESLNVNEIIKRSRRSQASFSLDEINLTNIVYKWLQAFYMVNTKLGQYEKIHVKLSEIYDEMDSSANFFTQNQKDNLTYFLGKAIFEHYKIENDENAKFALKIAFENMSGNFKKLKLNSEFYLESLMLHAEFNYELNNPEQLEKSIYYLEKLNGSRLKSESKLLDDADYLLVKCYSKKIMSNSNSDFMNPDYIKFNELFDRLKSESTLKTKEFAILNKLKIDLKVIKFKNDKTLESTLNIAKEGYSQFSSNLEILFYKAKTEYLSKCHSEPSLTKYLHECTVDSYAEARLHIQESHYYALKLNMDNLDIDDPRERTGYSLYVNQLINKLETSLTGYKSDEIDLNFYNFDIAQTYFIEKAYLSCVKHLKRIEEPAKIFLDNSNEYNLSFFYFMFGVSQMNSGEYESSLENLEKISQTSSYHDKSLLCSIYIHYRLQNYEHIVKTYPGLILRYYNNELLFDLHSYILSSRFWLNFNNFEKMTKLIDELERFHYNKDNLYQFYTSLTKLWIGLSKDFSSLKPNIQPMKQIDYKSIEKAAFKNTNELNFVNGVILYTHKNYLQASNLFEQFLNSGSSNKKCIVLAKFYNSHSVYYLIRDQINETSQDLKHKYVQKLNKIVETIAQEILVSECFENSQKELSKLLGNIFFDLTILTKSKQNAENSLNYLNIYFEPNFEYDDTYKLKIAICKFYTENFLECCEMLERIKEKDLIVKYYLSLSLKSLNSFSKAMDLITDVINNLSQAEPDVRKKVSDAYYQRGLVYRNMPQPDNEKALNDFIQQSKIDKNHTQACKNMIECLDLLKQSCTTYGITHKDMILFHVRILYDSKDDKQKWLVKTNALIKNYMIGKEDDEGRIYFSYNFGSRDKVFAIYGLFTKLGLKCYIDKENISAAMNDKDENMIMIAKSDVMINFVTPEYSESMLGLAETKKAFDEGLDIFPVVLKHPQEYLKEVNLLKQTNQMDKQVSLLKYFPKLNEFYEQDVSVYDFGNLSEQDFKEESLLNNHKLRKLVATIIYLTFE